MDSRQQVIEDLVLDFYRAQEGVTLRAGALGEHSLNIKSIEARAAFGGQERVPIVFDSDLAFALPAAQMVDANHPCLEMIRNHLLKDPSQDPRLAEAHLQPQLLDPNGEVTIPNLSIFGTTEVISSEIRYWGAIVLTYKLSFDADYFVQLAFGAENQTPIAGLPAKLKAMRLIGGRPALNISDDIPALDAILQLGGEIIAARVNVAGQRQAREVAERVSVERERIIRGFTFEARDIDSFRKAEHENLRLRREKSLLEIEEKEKFSINSSLSSLLHLWLPHVHYQVKCKGKKQDFVIEGISYDVIESRTDFQRCGKCGNEEVFQVCEMGQHIVCAGEECEMVQTCRTCGSAYCKDHGTGCENCGDPVCEDDELSCTYKKHRKRRRLCQNCCKLSFENAPICVDCGSSCAVCARWFPRNLLGVCCACSATVCLGHDVQPDSGICSECNHCVCSQHGIRTHEGNWVCQAHAKKATCCGRIFGESRLATCIEDSTELLCPEHTNKCAVCGNAICNGHVRRSAQGETLCQQDSKTCMRCEEQGVMVVHRRDQVYNCGICQSNICHQHAFRCPICERTDYCQEHQTDLSVCGSCGRTACGINGCNEAQSVCSKCGMAYCARCIPNDVCATCMNLRRSSYSEDVDKVVRVLAVHSDVKVAQLAESILASTKRCSIRAASNANWKVISLTYTPSVLRFFEKSEGIRIVTELNGPRIERLVWE